MTLALDVLQVRDRLNAELVCRSRMRVSVKHFKIINKSFSHVFLKQNGTHTRWEHAVFNSSSPIMFIPNGGQPRTLIDSGFSTWNLFFSPPQTENFLSQLGSWGGGSSRSSQTTTPSSSIQQDFSVGVGVEQHLTCVCMICRARNVAQHQKGGEEGLWQAGWTLIAFRFSILYLHSVTKKFSIVRTTVWPLNI